MEDCGAKVRLVRCPKCEKLLPELADYPVYRCGGCDATLQAKKLASVDVERFDEEPVRESRKVFLDETGTSLKEREDLGSDGMGEFREKQSFFHENEAIFNENGVSDFYMNGGGFQAFGYSRFNQGSKDGFLNVDEVNKIEVKSCEKEKMTVRNGVEKMERSVKDCHSHGKEKMIDFHGEKISKIDFDGKFCGFDSRVIQDSSDDNCEMVGMETGTGYDGGRFRVPSKMLNWVEQDREIRGKFDQFTKFQKAHNWRAAESDGGFGRNEDGHQMRKRRALRENQLHPNEGHESSCEYGDRVFGRVEYLEQDRMAILMKLDELRDQLSKSCNVSDKSKESIPVSSRMVPNSSSGSSGSNRTSRQFLPWGNLPPRSTYSNHEPLLAFPPVAPLMDRHDTNFPRLYPGKQTENEFLEGGRDQFGASILRTTSPSHDYLRRPVGVYDYRGNHQNGYSPGQLDMYPDPCLSCYNKQDQTQKHEIHRPPIGHTFFHGGPSSLGLQDYTGSDFPLHSRESNSHLRRFRNHESEFGYGKWRPQRAIMHTKGMKRYCQPLTGGAPFITCHNCFELLQLPKKFLVMHRNSHKLRCGACSQVISFSVNGKQLIFSTPARNRDPVLRVDNSSGEMGTLLDLGHSQGSFDSEDYNISGYNNCGMQKESGSMHNLEQMAGQAKCTGSEKMQDYSLSSSSSENEDDSGGFGSQKEKPKSEELPLRVNQTAPSLGSPPHGCLVSSSNELVTKFEKGSRSIRSDGGEALVSSKITFEQNYVKDASVATEIDCSLPTDSGPAISQDSFEVIKEEDRPKIKTSESFFVGLVKKSFGDFTRGNQSLENGKCDVSVNGKPILDRLVKRAAKQAGPIHPGEYWYDYRAGFWGVMGYRCLGIIPPFIEEFSYPMPKNCSGGNTGVIVNGRELHQKDLDLLAGRGLPTDRDKSYIIEITGTVMDEGSGKVLDSLGRLAPTVEKAKHGFGMRVPRTIAERKASMPVSVDS